MKEKLQETNNNTSKQTQEDKTHKRTPSRRQRMENKNNLKRIINIKKKIQNHKLDLEEHENED